MLKYHIVPRDAVLEFMDLICVCLCGCAVCCQFNIYWVYNVARQQTSGSVEFGCISNSIKHDGQGDIMKTICECLLVEDIY